MVIKYESLCQSVWIEGDCFRKEMIDLLVKADCFKAPSLYDADFVLFLGGEDVDPSLYGVKKHAKTFFNRKRDESCMAIYNECLTHNIPMVGVCRGSQFLHVMNGGELYQDVNNHTARHMMLDTTTNEVMEVSSTHHQMAKYNPDMKVIGTAYDVSDWRDYYDKSGMQVREKFPNEDIEAFWYQDTMSLGVQGHPEFTGFPAFSQWFISTIYDYLLEGKDV